MSEHTDAATALANATGRPKEAFEADEYDMPDFDELESIDPEVKELVKTMEGAMSDTDEYEIWLNPHDMDHLQGGQPVYKGIGEDTLITIRPREWDTDE